MVGGVTDIVEGPSVEEHAFVETDLHPYNRWYPILYFDIHATFDFCPCNGEEVSVVREVGFGDGVDSLYFLLVEGAGFVIVFLVYFLWVGDDFEGAGFELFGGGDVGDAHPADFEEGLVEDQEAERLVFYWPCVFDGPWVKLVPAEGEDRALGTELAIVVEDVEGEGESHNGRDEAAAYPVLGELHVHGTEGVVRSLDSLFVGKGDKIHEGLVEVVLSVGFVLFAFEGDGLVNLVGMQMGVPGEV
jgi:hypothetical protein